ncbi:MAG: hypothetical protein IPG09_05885 [Ignavibacteria bacterium]|nr:hypothetical protein [Ignavibacteria bacterium]
MKKIISLVILFIISQNTFAQIKERSSSSSVYAGMAYKFVYLTDNTVEDAYPFFQLNSGDFMKELDGFIGITFNERYTLNFHLLTYLQIHPEIMVLFYRKQRAFILLFTADKT